MRALTLLLLCCCLAWCCWVVDALSRFSRTTSVSSAADTGKTTLTPRRGGRLELVSRNPLMFVMDRFLTPEECDRALGLDKGALQAIKQRVADLTNPCHDGELGPRILTTTPTRSTTTTAESNANVAAVPDGLHVDTNNGMLFRYATALVYLTDMPHHAGGCTVFPLAQGGTGAWQQQQQQQQQKEEDKLVDGAKVLLSREIYHTRSNFTNRPDLAGLAQGIERAAVAKGRGIRVQPRKGRLCLFFSRDDAGQIDPFSWHGGEAVRVRGATREGPCLPPNSSRVLEDTGGAGGGHPLVVKKLLTLFKEVPVEEFDDFNGFALRVAAYRRHILRLWEEGQG